MLSALRAAVKVAQPPTLFGWRTGEGWTDTDRLLVLALQLYEDSLCKCGFPTWMGHAEEHAGEGLFSREYAHCLICEKTDEDPPNDIGPGDRPWIKNQLFELHEPRWMRRLRKLGAG